MTSTTTARKPRAPRKTITKGETEMTAAVLDAPTAETVVPAPDAAPVTVAPVTEDKRTRVTNQALNAVQVEEIELDFDPFAERDALKAAGKSGERTVPLDTSNPAFALLTASLDGLTAVDGKVTEGRSKALAVKEGETVDMVVKLVERAAHTLGQGKPVVIVRETATGPIVAFRARTKIAGRGRPKKTA